MTQLLAVLTYAAVFGNLFLAAFVSAAPADHPLPWWVVPLVAGGNAIIHALPSDGLPFPSKAAVKAMLVLSLGAYALALSACNGSALQTTQTVQSDIVSGIAAACQDAAASAAKFPLNPVSVYANGACPAGLAAASLVQNSATLQWLGQIIGQIQGSSAPAPGTPAPVPAPATKT